MQNRKDNRGGHNTDEKKAAKAAREKAIQQARHKYIEPKIFPWLESNDPHREWSIPKIYNYFVEFLNSHKVLPTELATDLVHTLALNHYFLAISLDLIRRGDPADDYKEDFGGKDPYRMAQSCQTKINDANTKLGIHPFTPLVYNQLEFDEEDDKVVKLEDFSPKFRD